MCQCRPLSVISKATVASRALQQAAGHTAAAAAASAAQSTQMQARALHTVHGIAVHHETLSQEQKKLVVHAPNVTFANEASQNIKESGIFPNVVLTTTSTSKPILASTSGPAKPYVPQVVSLNDEPDEVDEIKPGEKPSKVKMFKQLMREYGSTFVVCYGTAWVTNFAVVYAVMGLAHFDGLAMLQQTGIENMLHMDLHTVPPQAVTGLVAMEITEQLDIVRLPLLFKATPALAHWWRNKHSDHKDSHDDHHIAPHA
eukprot:c957_g1_i1.p1 GENE.c957_g1_i1~~c957_g1_i1.p1  ORF type:complete len:257 (-),score=55.48 c957_g1_i1:197-967(-)